LKSTATATSSNPDDEHLPHLCIDGTEGGWWSSNPGDDNAIFEVVFPRPYAIG